MAGLFRLQRQHAVQLPGAGSVLMEPGAEVSLTDPTPFMRPLDDEARGLYEQLRLAISHFDYSPIPQWRTAEIPGYGAVAMLLALMDENLA